MQRSRTLTLDSNVMIAALKRDESQSSSCAALLEKVPDRFMLSEPSIIYEEVCGTLARRVGRAAADEARKQLDRMINSDLLAQCDKLFCISAYQLCLEYQLYAIDALYLQTALNHSAVLVSLDKRDFVDRVNSKPSPVEAFHPSQFPY
jgi:predicted nucleic acid-binding protein